MSIHDLPESVSAAEIEKHLDRVAQGIAMSEYGETYLCLFEYLEGQLDMKQKKEAVMERVRARLINTSEIV